MIGQRVKTGVPISADAKTKSDPTEADFRCAGAALTKGHACNSPFQISKGLIR